MIGKKVLHFSSLDSTNEYAKSILNKVSRGTVIVADTQSAGKGRLGRHWYSPKGGLWFSVILKPKNPALMSLAMGIGVCDVLNALGFKICIKWPNDILIGSKKIAGILTEIIDETIIVGFGINLNIKTFPDDLKGKATSTMIESGENLTCQKILDLILENIEQRYIMTEHNIEKLLDDWRHYSTTIGKKVQIEMPNSIIEGVAVDIDKDGALLVKTDGGVMQKIFAGDCICCT